MYRLLLTLIIFSLPALAQNDTLFFTKDWSKTTRDKAYYISPAPVIKGDHSEVLLYYINGQPYSFGSFNTKDVQRLADKDSAYAYRNGLFTWYDTTGKKITEGTFVMGKMHGEWKYYDPESGRKTVDGMYVKNKMHGEWKYYHRENGNLWIIGNYYNDTLNGVVKSFYPNGNRKREAAYRMDSLVIGKMYDINGNAIAYTAFRKNAEAGYDLDSYMAKKLKYPRKAQWYNVEGHVFVRFAVEEDGSITDVMMVRRANKLLVEAAIKLVMDMPKWKPALLDDHPVKSTYILPVTFQLK